MVLSVIHGLLPDHWIPLVMVSKTEKWSRAESLLATALVGIPHTASTILIGIIIGLIGYQVSSYQIVARIVAPLILATLGAVYVFLDFKGTREEPHQNPRNTDVASKRSRVAIITSLGTALFLSPCVAIGAYYFIARGFGWLGIAVVSATYLIVTILTMIMMVNLGIKGVEKIKWHFLEQHDKLVTGIVLVILGILVYFIEI